MSMMGRSRPQKRHPATQRSSGTAAVLSLGLMSLLIANTACLGKKKPAEDVPEEEYMTPLDRVLMGDNPGQDIVSGRSDMVGGLFGHPTSDCTDYALPEGDFMERLSLMGGCGDVFLYATDEAHTVTLMISVLNPRMEAQEAKTVITQSATLPDSRIDLQVFIGEEVGKYNCNDYMTANQRIDHRYTATAGTLTWTNGPGLDIYPIDVTLSDAVVTDASGCTLSVPTLSWEELLVGWYD